MADEIDICPVCTGAGGDNNIWTCGTCNGTGGVPKMADELDMDALALIGAKALCCGKADTCRGPDEGRNCSAVFYSPEAQALLTAIDLPAIIKRAKAEAYEAGFKDGLVGLEAALEIQKAEAYEDAAKVADQAATTKGLHGDEFVVGNMRAYADMIAEDIRQRAKEQDA